MSLREPRRFMELMERKVLISAVILCTALSVSVGSRMKETTSTYACCRNPTLEFNPKCDYSWEVNKQIIAKYYSGSQGNDCHPPCEALTDGRLILDRCVEVKADCDCDKGEFVEGETIHYLAESCSNAAHRNFCSSLLLLLGLMLAGLLLRDHRFWLFFVVS